MVSHTVKGFSIVKEAEVDAFLEFSSFFYDPADVGNLICKNTKWLSGEALQIAVKRREEKSKGTRDQIANIHWIKEKAREFQKNIYFCFTDYAKAFDCVDHNKLWKILKEMGRPDHLTCLLRNLYAGQEATVRTGHGTTDWLQIGKGIHQG